MKRSTVPRSGDYGKFLSVQGTVIRSTLARILEHRRRYLCARCGAEALADADYEQHYAVQPPPTCPDKKCRSFSFSFFLLLHSFFKIFLRRFQNSENRKSKAQLGRTSFNVHIFELTPKIMTLVTMNLRKTLSVSSE